MLVWAEERRDLGPKFDGQFSGLIYRPLFQLKGVPRHRHFSREALINLFALFLFATGAFQRYYVRTSRLDP